MIFIFYLLILGSYCLAIFILYGWELKQDNGKEKSQDLVSVIIPVRNEEKNIKNLLDDLELQSIGALNFEVVIVDDNSTDGTYKIVTGFKKSSLLNLKLFRNSLGKGKKGALTLGIKEASGDILITTDGDCRVGKHWIEEYLTGFHSQNTNMVVGPVSQIHDGSGLGHFQALEFAALQTTTKACLSLGIPTMCNGANLAFRRRAFENVGGYGDNFNILSGDDEFLMHKVWQEQPGSVKYLKSILGLVTTPTLNNVNEVWNQKLRWAGKWKDYKNPASRWIGLIIFLFNVNIIYGWMLLLVGHLPILTFGIALIIKAFFDFMIIFRFTNFFRLHTSLFYFAISEIVYPFYAVIIAITSLRKIYRWKDRLSYA